MEISAEAKNLNGTMLWKLFQEQRDQLIVVLFWIGECFDISIWLGKHLLNFIFQRFQEHLTANPCCRISSEGPPFDDGKVLKA